MLTSGGFRVELSAQQLSSCTLSTGAYTQHVQCLMEGPQPWRVQLMWAWLALTLLVSWCRGRLGGFFPGPAHGVSCETAGTIIWCMHAATWKDTSFQSSRPHHNHQNHNQAPVLFKRD